MNIITATVTQVQIGPSTLQGLMTEDGVFGVAVPQLSEQFQFDKNQASRKLKALLGKGFQFAKWKTEIHPKAVNVILLADLELMIFELAMQGNPTAIAFSRALIGLSLHQLFCDAFGQKFEAEDRQWWLNTRLATKVDFRLLTDQLQRHGFVEGWEYGQFIRAMQDSIGIDKGTRDEQEIASLVKLQGLQIKLVTLMECGVDPWDALKRI